MKKEVKSFWASYTVENSLCCKLSFYYLCIWLAELASNTKTILKMHRNCDVPGLTEKVQSGGRELIIPNYTRQLQGYEQEG